MSGLYARLAIVLGGFALLGAVVVGAYRAGVDAERQRQAAEWADAFTESVQRAVDTGRTLIDVGRELSATLSESRAREVSTVRAVREVIDANPDYAALRRPADLQRLRDERHARLSAAAGVPEPGDGALRARPAGPAEPDAGR